MYYGCILFKTKKVYWKKRDQRETDVSIKIYIYIFPFSTCNLKRTDICDAKTLKKILLKCKEPFQKNFITFSIFYSFSVAYIAF